MNGTKTAPAALQRDEGQQATWQSILDPELTGLRKHARRMILDRYLRQMCQGLESWT